MAKVYEFAVCERPEIPSEEESYYVLSDSLEKSVEMLTTYLNAYFYEYEFNYLNELSMDIFYSYELRNENFITEDKIAKIESETKENDSEPDTYGIYILKWLISHGYSLEELKEKIDGIYFNCVYNEIEFSKLSHKEQSDYVWKLFMEQGFNGEIWACYDEWKNNEGGKK